MVIDGKTRYCTVDPVTGYATYYISDTSYYGTKGEPCYVVASATVRNGEEFRTLSDGTVIYKEVGADGVATYYSVDENGAYTLYEYHQSIKDYYDSAVATAEQIREATAEMATLGGDVGFDEAVQAKIDRNNINRDEVVEEEEEEEYSRYATENIVAVTYGIDNTNPYKTIILNYNNYAVRVVYDGMEYTIPAYEFVVIQR